MKLNWGTSIVIAFALFMSFILYFVCRVQGNPKYDNELVVEEYYKKDSHYSEEMVKEENVLEMAGKPSITLEADGIKISFPPETPSENITGEVSLYRPSAKKLDFTVPLKLSGKSMLIPKNDLVAGRWDTTLSWTCNGKEYVMKKQIYLD